VAAWQDLADAATAALLVGNHGAGRSTRGKGSEAGVGQVVTSASEVATGSVHAGQYTRSSGR
jgi:hypothetical protein